MSAARKPNIADRYQWLVDLLEAEFPGKISTATGDYGHMFAVGITNGKDGDDSRCHAARVEYTVRVGGILVPTPTEDDPDGSTIAGGRWRHYSLNDDPNKDAGVAKILAAFRKVAHA